MLDGDVALSLRVGGAQHTQLLYISTADPSVRVFAESNELSLHVSVAQLAATVRALSHIVPTFAVNSPWAPPARAAVNQAAATPLPAPIARPAPPIRSTQAGVVRAMAVARHLTCTLQHIKRNAETEGQG